MDYLRSMSKVKRRLIFPLVALVVFALVGVIPASADLGYNTGSLPDNCVKFESEDLETGTKTSADGSFEVTLSAWTELDDDGEPHNFDFSGPDPDDLSYFMYKAGKATFPGGDVLSEKAISNVVFCGPDGDPDPDPDPDPEPATLKIRKTVDDQLGDGTYTFDVDGDGVAFIETISTSGLQGMGATHEVEPGVWTVVEDLTTVGGFFISSIDCIGSGFTHEVLTFPFSDVPYGVEVTLTEGGGATCTFHNVLDFS